MPEGEKGPDAATAGKSPSSRLYIGTSGWSYPKGAGTWDGTFYPPKLKDPDKLTFYAQYFNTVEINSTFYRPPSPYAARAWASKVPEDFRFTAKLWQKFTHPKMFEAATGQAASVQDEDFGIFTEGIGPLAEAGKLGPLLAQFPTSFRPDPGTLEYLEAGDYLNHDLSGYHVPTCADIEQVDAFWLEEDDPHVNPMGAKGIGEIGIVGTAAAIANAVYHATGKRIRELPITLDKLLGDRLLG